jgi:hypothetical protein
MKKTLLFLGICCLVSTISVAQDSTKTNVTINTNSSSVSNSLPTDNREKYQFGLKAGMCIADVFAGQGSQFHAESKYALTAGAMIHFPITKYFGFQPEISVSQKGFKGSGELLASPYNFTRTSFIMDIPLQMVFKPTEFISLLTGFQYSYLIKQRNEFTTSFSSYSQEQVFRNETLRRSNAGFICGADINLKHMVLGARASWDFFRNTTDDSAITPRYKNVCFLGTVGYKFYTD